MASLLLDTHVVLWAASTPEKLSAPTRRAIADLSTTILVSSVSAAEIEIKRTIGKLRLEVTCQELVASIGATWLDLTAAHASELRDLPLLHRDPFDRLIVAQAVGDGLVVVTADPMVQAYDVECLSA